MKRLHALTFKSYIGPFILTFFIAVFLLLMQFLWKWIDDLVGKGLELNVLGELLMYASVSLVPMALPLSILLSSIMTFGNMGEYNELLALKSSGVSLQRIMAPLVIIVFLISVAAFFFSNNVLPFTNLKMGSLLYDIRHQRPELNLKPGVFNNEIDGYSMKIGRKDHTNNMMYRIMIYNHTKNDGNVNVTIADSGFMSLTEDEQYLIFTLFNGHSYSEMLHERDKKYKQDYPHRRDNFEEERIIIDMSGFEFTRTDEKLFRQNYQMLNVKQLSYAVDSLQGKLSERQTNFNNNLKKTYYFKKEIKDSARLAKLSAGQDIYDVEPNSFNESFEELNHSGKMKVIDVAQNYARTTKTYLSSTSLNTLAQQKWIRRHQVEWHKKFTLAFACFILFFIGAPLGAIIRKGGVGMPTVVSVLFFIMYYIISIAGEKYVRSGILQPYVGMWISSFILLPLGIFLTYKATTDSMILNIDTYFSFFKKFFNKENNQESVS